jgi:hypothetical protein
MSYPVIDADIVEISGIIALVSRADYAFCRAFSYVPMAEDVFAGRALNDLSEAVTSIYGPCGGTFALVKGMFGSSLSYLAASEPMETDCIVVLDEKEDVSVSEVDEKNEDGEVYVQEAGKEGVRNGLTVGIAGVCNACKDDNGPVLYASAEQVSSGLCVFCTVELFRQAST